MLLLLICILILLDKMDDYFEAVSRMVDSQLEQGVAELKLELIKVT